MLARVTSVDGSSTIGLAGRLPLAMSWAMSTAFWAIAHGSWLAEASTWVLPLSAPSMSGAPSTEVMMNSLRPSCLAARSLPTACGSLIVNTASINGLVGNGAQPGYTASKHGVVGLTRHGALRWAQAGIRVNCVCPGVIETPMTAPLTANPDMKKILDSMTPMGRMGKAEEIATAVMWLCSDQASFVTGHPLVVDGGATAD